MIWFLRLGRRVVLWLWLSMALAVAAAAHEVQPAIADVRVGAETVEIDLRLAVEPILAGIDLSAVSDTEESPLNDLVDRFRAMPPEALEPVLRDAWPSLAARMTLTVEGTELTPTLAAVAIPPVGDTELRRDSTLTITAPLPPGDAPVVFGWDGGLGGLIVRQIGENASYEVFLTGGSVTEPMPRLGVAEQLLAQVAQRYTVSGFVHVVPDGLDHILFVLGLFFYALAWRPLLWQVTSFTLAHATTLALATAGAIVVPGDRMWVVETIIAASIVWIAVENVLGPKDREIGWGRIGIVFLFGLAHGLGFASVLSEFGVGANLAATLAFFTLGLEIGHLSVISVAYLLLAVPLGDSPRYRSLVVVPGSLIIATIGAYWVLNRIGLMGDLPFLT